MTGSGKSGLLMVLVEEALRNRIPVLMLDIKGDLPNLGLAFPDFSAEAFEPWVEPGPGDTRTASQLAAALAAERQRALEAWGLTAAEARAFHEQVDLRVITPGSTTGEPLHVLSALEQSTANWQKDPDDALESLSAAVSLLLRLVGRDADPAKSREHVLLAVCAERRMKAGLSVQLEQLLTDVVEPPFETIGSLAVESFISSKQRADLAAALNTLLASPSFAKWRKGAPLDVGAWLTPHTPRAGAADAELKTPAVIVSVAHLDDEERSLVLGMVLEECLTWMRGLPGTKHLRALIVFDEVYGFLPPYPKNPPTKQPIVTLMKQGRAFGVGVLLATQNPMDVDYRALSNAGLWFVGRLQTDADRERVIEGLSEATGAQSRSSEALTGLVKQLTNRWFLMRNAQTPDGAVLVQPRWALSYLRGPMTPNELRRVCVKRATPR
jgi:hypothetical protein